MAQAEIFSPHKVSDSHILPSDLVDVGQKLLTEAFCEQHKKEYENVKRLQEPFYAQSGNAPTFDKNPYIAPLGNPTISDRDLAYRFLRECDGTLPNLKLLISSEEKPDYPHGRRSKKSSEPTGSPLVEPL